MRRSAALFSGATMLAYAAFALLITARRHFDLSTLVVAGDRFVDAAQATGLYVRPHSDGYDGQFYARMAIDPFSTALRVHGIAFDYPAWRVHRMLYPLLAYLASFSNPALVPTALLAVNLAGLGVIAWLAWRLTARSGMPRAIPIAIVAWPGFAVAVSHDTTEIAAAACLLGAIAAWLDGRLLRYVLFAAGATLARETSILVLAGIAAVEAIGVLRRRRISRRFATAALSILPFLAWRTVVDRNWVGPRNSHSGNMIDWPLRGPLVMLARTAAHLAHASSLKWALLDLYVLASTAALLAFCAFAIRALVRLTRQHGLVTPISGLAAGFLLLVALMSLLSANAPWVEPTAYFRFFTECFVLGCCLIGWSINRPIRPAAQAALATTGALTVIGNAAICFIQLH